MRFEFIRCATVPKLAWCARLERGGEVARVYHGPDFAMHWGHARVRTRYAEAVAARENPRGRRGRAFSSR
jgi:hypothetical protein